MHNVSSPVLASTKIDRVVRNLSSVELRILRDMQAKAKELSGTEVTLRETINICLKTVVSEPGALQKVANLARVEQTKDDLAACENRAHQAALERALVEDGIIYAKRNLEELDGEMAKANEETSIARAAYKAAIKQANNFPHPRSKPVHRPK